jgi:hypothetical protein
MAITNGYITQAELIARLDPNAEITETDAEKTQMDHIIEAVSRMIDGHCGRKFYLSTETRYFTPSMSNKLYVGDLMSLTTLKTDNDLDYTYENTWSDTDYDLLPYNAQSNTSEIRPYNAIEIKYNGLYSFFLNKKSVEIAGVWGFCTATEGNSEDVCPIDVKEACYLQCVKQYDRRSTPNVTLGPTTFGSIKVPEALDPDVKKMLNPYRAIL